MAVVAGDYGLIFAAGDTAGLCAVRQAESCGIGVAVGYVIGLPVHVQQEDSFTEGLGLDDADSWVLSDAYGFGFSGVVRVPDPGLSVRVHDEDPAAGGEGGDGLCLSGEACCRLLSGLCSRILGAGLAGLEGVDLPLLVHG